MFAQVLANLEGVDLASFNTTTPIFNDVAPGAWYFAAIQWGYEAGVVMGVGAGNFAPDQSITREQMAVMMYRFVEMRNIQLPEGVTLGFNDQEAISYWAVESVDAMSIAGVFVGRPNGAFDPGATATRAEVAAAFARFLDLIN
jgi:hypothetical protein